MAKWLKTLAKVGLVELEEDDVAKIKQDEGNNGAFDEQALEALLRDDVSGVEGKGGALKSMLSGTATDGAGIVEVDLNEIYRTAGVTTAPYAAEKLLRVLEGLRAMDLATRRAAVMAMDAADDAWTIQDPILDAQRKVKALEAAKISVGELVEQKAVQAEKAIAAQEEYQDKASATIRQQIADLEATLQQELTKVAEEKAEIRATLQAAREAAVREIARYELEIDRLRELPATFIAQPTREAAPSKKL